MKNKNKKSEILQGLIYIRILLFIIPRNFLCRVEYFEANLKFEIYVWINLCSV